MLDKLRGLLVRIVTGSPVEALARGLYGRLSRGRGAVYDRQTERVMARWLKPDSNCIDVGCYRGELLRAMIRHAPRGKHMAFEPLPENARYLASKFRSVTVHEMALSDREGEETFHRVVERPARSGLGRMTRPDAYRRVEELTVRVGTLDGVVPPGLEVDFIKIDVEGAEVEVLRGGRRLIARCKPVIVFEVGLGSPCGDPANASELFDMLTAECGLEVSLMQRWLDGQPALDRLEFARLCRDGPDFCFMAYPRHPGLPKDAP